MKKAKTVCIVLLILFYVVLCVLALFAGQGKISVDVIKELLVIFLAVIVVLIFIFGGKECIKYYVNSFRNMKSCGDLLFDELDDFRLHCGESKEHYQDMINAIDYFYMDGGKVDNNIGSNLKRLYGRLEYLKKGIALNEHMVTCVTSLGLSIAAAIFFEVALGGVQNSVLVLLAVLLGLIVFMCVLLYPYSDLYKSGERQVMVYELKCLEKKIERAESENIILHRDEDIMFSRRNILNVLNDMNKGVFKKRGKELFQDIKTVERLNLYVQEIGECRKERFTIGKTGREGVLLFDLTGNLVNEEYQTLYRILRKYMLVYENGDAEKKSEEREECSNKEVK